MGSFLLQSRLSHSTLNEDKLVTIIAKDINDLGQKQAHEQTQESRVYNRRIKMKSREKDKEDANFSDIDKRIEPLSDI